MRYILYLLTLSLVFSAGMMVGNIYIPHQNTSLAAAVSIPDLASDNPALQQITLEKTTQALADLTQALSACPVVVEAEKDDLFHRISLFLARQDFEIKKAVYAAEIAKNISENRTTAQFSRAATDYFNAKQLVEQQVDLFFPIPPAPEPEVSQEETAPAAEETTPAPAENTPAEDIAAPQTAADTAAAAH